MRRNEIERMALRDVEKVQRMLTNSYIAAPSLLRLQNACDRLLETDLGKIKTAMPDSTPDGTHYVLRCPRYLYHGTSEAAAANILKRGLMPRGDREPNHPQAPSHPDCVYLTDAYAWSFAGQATKFGARGAIIEIEIEQPMLQNFRPDEDALGPWRDPRGVIDVREESSILVDVLYRSLHQHGTVAHSGVVPASSIRRVAYIPTNFPLCLAMTRWKTTEDRALIRAQQKLILRWLFDGGDEPFPIAAERFVFCDLFAEMYAALAVGSEAEAQELKAAGVRPETLWRLRLMENHDLLNRRGIEVVSVASPTPLPADCLTMNQ